MRVPSAVAVPLSHTEGMGASLPARAWSAGALVAFALAGCGGPTPLGEHVAGLPAGLDATISTDTTVVGVDADGRILIVTWGSSSCPAVPVRVGLDDAGRLQVTTGPARVGDCTTDIVPTTSVVPAPDGFDRTTSDIAVVDGTEVPLAALSLPS